MQWTPVSKQLPSNYLLFQPDVSNDTQTLSTVECMLTDVPIGHDSKHVRAAKVAGCLQLDALLVMIIITVSSTLCSKVPGHYEGLLGTT
jgi:hypothetical protein